MGESEDCCFDTPIEHGLDGSDGSTQIKRIEYFRLKKVESIAKDQLVRALYQIRFLRFSSASPG